MPIISVVAWIGVNLLPNAVVSHGLLEKLILGLYIGEGRAGSSSVAVVDPAGYTTTEDGPERLAAGLASTKKLVELLHQGGANEALMVEDIQAQRYSKNLWNASLSSLCTLSRSTVAEVVESEVLPFTLPVVRRTMLEVLYVARAWGYTEGQSREISARVLLTSSRRPAGLRHRQLDQNHYRQLPAALRIRDPFDAGYAV